MNGGEELSSRPHPFAIDKRLTERVFEDKRVSRPIFTCSLVTYRIYLFAFRRENRAREKRELTQLNDRFATYIERVRFLEAQSRKLHADLDHFR